MTLVDITSITLKADDKTKLNRYAKKYKMNRSAVIRLALRRFFEKEGSP